MPQFSKLLPVATFAAALGLAPLVHAEEAPATSEIKSKISVEGGNYDGKEGVVAHGVVTIPLGDAFGFQLDASVGNVRSEDYRGIAGHAYWRDSQVALFGLTASTEHYAGYDFQRYGAEAEGYLGKFTVGARAAHQNSDLKSGDVFNASVRWYSTDNLAFSLIGDHATGRSMTTIETEWLPNIPNMPGLAAYLDLGKGSSNYDMAVAGVRYYFGGQKSLINRHRQDGSNSLLPNGAINNPVPVSRLPAAVPQTTGFFATNGP